MWSSPPQEPLISSLLPTTPGVTVDDARGADVDVDSPLPQNMQMARITTAINSKI